MRRLVLYCILFLLSISLVQGALWEDTVDNGESFSTPLGEFSARLFESEGFITFFGEGYSIRLSEGECSSEGNYKFCFDSKSEKEYDYKRDKPVYQLNLRIEEVKPTISISNDQDELLIGETTTITVEVQNHEDERMKYNYEDLVPSNFEIIEADKVKFSKNKVSDTKIIDKGTDTFSYTIKKAKQGTATLRPKLEYLYEGEYKNTELDDITIKDKSRLSLDADLSSTSVELLQEVTLEVNMESRVIDKDLDVKSLEITIPEMLVVKEFNETLKRTGNKFSWSGTLSENEIDFKFLLSPTQLGESNITINVIAYEEENKEELDAKIEFSTKFEEIDLTLSVPSKIFQSRNLMKAGYENSNSITEFKNINCEMMGLFNATYIIKTARPGVETTMEDSYFWINNQTPAGNYTQVLNCIYELPNKETMFETKIKNITINLTPEEEVEIEVETLAENETFNESININETKPGIFKRFWNWMTGKNAENNQTEIIEPEVEEDKPGIFKRFWNWMTGKNKENDK